MSGILQRLILGPLLFNIFLCDVFLTIDGNRFTDYADDTTPYVLVNNAEEVVSKLKAITQKLFTWFTLKEMKANLGKCRLLLSITDAFNFNFVQLWMRHSRALKNKINRLHGRCLQIIYNDKTSTFKEFLEDNSVSVHYRNIQALPTESYKVANEMSPEKMNEIFQLRDKSHYNLRYTTEFIIPPIHSVYHGSESVYYLGPKIWDLISSVIRQIDTFSGFKKAIKKWKPTNCPCRICKTDIPSIGFL